MMMVPVTDANIKTSLLMHLIEHLDRGELIAMLDDNQNHSILDRLRQLNCGALLRLANMNQPKINITFDADSIESGLNLLNRQDQDINDLVYFIANGASLSMLNQLFASIDPTIIDAYRNMLVANRKSGRTPLPSVTDRDVIHQQWHQIQQPQATMRERLRALHAHFNKAFSMDALFTTIHEFADSDTRK